ncbi:Alpha/Beta hydrolase protein [Pseudomassariella vexata]|uniref:Alpha/Beta hydrolase protein n=1 Tax=Pseudomassariella vexata TaxID=1141098 RepID=A0A1Y2EJ44_9PEZI|nr:Alpha/Beta hydrolase protein [Pseudomassariella vexata]ORY71598.1 Alpha/Beta hydrolase protein [Pseudomassariella vexata]
MPATARAESQAVDCTGINAVSPKCSTNETAYFRDFFYLGGRYLTTSSGNLTFDQLYVEKLTPALGVSQPKPLVFFHGGAVSGVTWLNTPDNRKGFASYFLERGFMVYLVDHTSVGRSSQMDTADYVLWNTTTAEGVEAAFTAPELAAAYPQAVNHTQWPGTGIKGDPYFDAFRKTVIPFTSNWTTGELSMRASACDLLDHIGPSYLISHSSGATYSVLLSNDCPQNVAGNINLEHSTQPFWNYGSTLNSGSAIRPWGLANTPLDYDPPITNASELVVEIVGNDTLALRNCHLQAEPARQLPKIASVPYLCITGEASVHATYDHCVIEYLKQAGANPDWIKLADLGIHGNGHFMHLEMNNLEIAAVVEGWILKTESSQP